MILDSANAMAPKTGQGRFTINMSDVERMLQAAVYGAQALDSAARRASEVPPAPPPVEEPAPPMPEGGDMNTIENARQVHSLSVCTTCSDVLCHHHRKAVKHTWKLDRHASDAARRRRQNGGGGRWVSPHILFPMVPPTDRHGPRSPNPLQRLRPCVRQVGS